MSHALFHTQLSHTHTIFHTLLCHTHHLSSSHTIFHIQLCHTQLCFTCRSSTTSFVVPSSPSPLQHVVLIIGRRCLVGLSGPLLAPGSKNHGIYSVLWPAPSKNSGIYAVFSMLREVLFPCQKDKNTINYSVLAFETGEKRQKTTNKCPKCTWLQNLGLVRHQFSPSKSSQIPGKCYFHCFFHEFFTRYNHYILLYITVTTT